jgi:hypothetical protein
MRRGYYTHCVLGTALNSLYITSFILKLPVVIAIFFILEDEEVRAQKN